MVKWQVEKRPGCTTPFLWKPIFHGYRCVDGCVEIDTDRSIISSFAIVGKGKGRKRSITGHLPGAYAMAALEYQCAASESLDERERERREK